MGSARPDGAWPIACSGPAVRPVDDRALDAGVDPYPLLPIGPDGTGHDGMDVLMRRREDDRPARRVGALVRSFRATPTSGRAIRSFVRDALGEAHVPDHVVADVELVVSELAGNAIEHGAGDELTVEVDATRRPWLTISVTCVGEAAPALRAWRTWAIAPPDARSGRGLGIVRRLMDDVDVEARGGRVTVRCRRRVLPGE